MYTWTAPFARGIDLTHQITDLLGIAVAGTSGNQLMGFGFPDQTIVWDAVAIENTVGALIEEQSPLQRMANPRPSQWVWLQPLYGAGATSGTSRDAIGETLVVTLL